MKYFTFFLCFILWACGGNDETGLSNQDPNNPPVSTSEWVVPKNEVLGNFSPFPLALDPILFKASEINFINDDVIVALISFGEEVRIYPSNYIHSYEVVNDTFENHKFAITYCPITKSIVGFNRNFDSKTLTIRASGYLYKENQVLHDAATDTFWSQLELRCIKGIYQKENYNTYNLLETTWKTAKKYFPDAKVFTNASTNKFNQSKNLKNPPENDDPIYGIIEMGGKDSSIHAYRLELFSPEITVFTQNINGVEVIIVGNEELRFITSYINNEGLEFTPIQNDFPNIMQDSNGNIWNVFGIATTGSRKGDKLNSPVGFFASWWAWEDFYDSIDVKQ